MRFSVSGCLLLLEGSPRLGVLASSKLLAMSEQRNRRAVHTCCSQREAAQETVRVTRGDRADTSLPDVV